jgi:hypothetical protein
MDTKDQERAASLRGFIKWAEDERAELEARISRINTLIVDRRRELESIEHPLVIEDEIRAWTRILRGVNT